MSESKFVILGGGMVAGYSAWSNRFEAGRVGNSIGGYRPWNHSGISDNGRFGVLHLECPRFAVARQSQQSACRSRTPPLISDGVTCTWGPQQ